MSYTPCEKCGKLCQKVWCERCEDLDFALELLADELHYYENNVAAPGVDTRYIDIGELLIKYGKKGS